MLEAKIYVYCPFRYFSFRTLMYITKDVNTYQKPCLLAKLGSATNLDCQLGLDIVN